MPGLTRINDQCVAVQPPVTGPVDCGANAHNNGVGVCICATGYFRSEDKCV